MMEKHQKELDQSGFSVIENVYSVEEIKAISLYIDKLDTSNAIFRKSEDLFAPH